MGNDAFDKGNIPNYALWGGKRVKILYYVPGAKRPFHILNRHDQQIAVPRNQLVFLKDKAKK